MLTLCPGYKLELATRNGFNLSTLNKDCEKYYVNVYYLFIKAFQVSRYLRKQVNCQVEMHIGYMLGRTSSGSDKVEFMKFVSVSSLPQQQ